MRLWLGMIDRGHVRVHPRLGEAGRTAAGDLVPGDGTPRVSGWCRMKRLRVLLGVVFITSAVTSSFAQPQAKGELVKVQTDDGITLTGAVWTPLRGKARVGVVLAHGGSGYFYNDWLTWLGGRFAGAGYIALSMHRRDHGEEHWFHEFEPSAMDHKYMVDLLAGRGAEVVVLVGHSYGTLTAPYYVAASNDPRVKAMVLLAPHGYRRDGLTRSFPSRVDFDAAVAKAREMVAAGRGKESFLIPSILPGARPRLSSYEVFLNKGGPDTKAIPVEILARVGDRPILAIRDPADPYPATVPPAEQQLKAANRNLEYVLLSDTRNGKMDAAAHRFSGREEEVFGITVDWLKRHGLGR